MSEREGSQREREATTNERPEERGAVMREERAQREREGSQRERELTAAATIATADDRIDAARLRALFLFERLDEDKIDWLVEQGRVERRAAGESVCREGDPATCFYVLLDGTVVLTRTVRGDDVETGRTDQPGVYGGATQAYLGDRVPQIYLISLRAVTDSRFFVLPAEKFGRVMRDWFPMAMHLLEGLFFGMRASQAIIGERERLLALGSLSAGLTHELNNPAAAAVRATSALRERVAGMRHKLGLLAGGRIDPASLPGLVKLQEAAVELVAKAPKLGPMEASDAEDAVGDWLTDHGVADSWDIAPTLVAGGLNVEWLGGIIEKCGQDCLNPAVRWLAYTVETELLMNEIEDSTTRISTLVTAAKQYSQMDRAPHQVVNVHDLLDSTLVMLTRKIGEARVVKEYDRSLPPIPAYAAELNQVWTNLIDNALAAMGGAGTLTIRTRREDGWLVVDVADTGPGVPAEIRGRIFEPFFTTKPVGEGTGLGLDISWRIVVNKHHGDIRVISEPGDTTFEVRLPIDGAGD